MNTVVAYTVHVPSEGYEWMPVTADMLLVAEQAPLGRVHFGWNPLGDETPKLLLRRKPSQRMSSRFGPLDDGAVFRTFASMEPTPAEIVAFADRYGSLWKTSVGPFSEWEFEVRTMRFLVELWDAIVAKKRSGIIQQHFHADESGAIDDPFEPRAVDGVRHREWETLLSYHVYGVPRPKRYGYSPFHMKAEWKVPLLEAARRYLLEALNARLESTGAALRFDRFWSHSQLTVEPRSLIGALWAQFAVAVSENKEFRQCGTCGRSFELTPDIARTSRFYCDDACRVKAYRQRKAKAHRLRAAGKSPQQIAGELDSTPETIKKWLKTAKKSKKDSQR